LEVNLKKALLLLATGVGTTLFSGFTLVAKPPWYTFVRYTAYGPYVSKSDLPWILLLIVGVLLTFVASIIYSHLIKERSFEKTKNDWADEKLKNDNLADDEKPNREIIMGDDGEPLNHVVDGDEPLTLNELLR
jgi:hypothetical protein